MSHQYYPYPFVPVTQALNDPSARAKRKRRRQTSGGESEDDEAASQELDDDETQKDYLAEASLPTHIAHQYRIAGQPFTQDPPGAGFPHRAQVRPEGLLTTGQLATELANVKPPVLETVQQNQQLSRANVILKQTHLATLYTLMHKCLLQVDHIRAARAMGMLLRTEISGEQIDLRSQNIWGMGAEMLLQSKGQSLRTLEGHGEGQNEQSLETNTIPLTREGFDQAKDFYERLILEFPYQKWRTDKLSALHIYPVMFSQWIAFITDQETQAIANLQGDSNASLTLDDDSDAFSEDLASYREELESIRKATLEKAREIANKMDEVMQTYPHSDDATMWRLRGDLHLWSADLSIASKSRRRSDGDLSDSDDSTSSRNRNSSKTQERREHSQQTQHAEEVFSKAKDCSIDSFGVLLNSTSEPVNSLKRSVSTSSMSPD